MVSYLHLFQNTWPGYSLSSGVEYYRVGWIWKRNFILSTNRTANMILASHSTECLKRAHQSTAAVSDQLFQNCLFPVFACHKHIPSSEPHFYGNCKLDLDGNSAVRQTLSLQGQAASHLILWRIHSVTRKKKGITRWRCIWVRTFKKLEMLFEKQCSKFVRGYQIVEFSYVLLQTEHVMC